MKCHMTTCCHMTYSSCRLKMSGYVAPSASLRSSVLIFIFGILVCYYTCTVGAVIQSAVIDKQTGKLSLVEGYHPDYVAWANFTDDISNSG